jgi:hypothetical protein
MPRKPAIVSHWHQLYENFSTSSRDFYAAVEEAIKKRKLPDLSFSRVTWKESGVLSAKREYLRVARGRLHWDICAAPFGTGFFFSSRLAVYPSRLAGLVYLLLFSAGWYGLFRLYDAFLFHNSLASLGLGYWDILKHGVLVALAFFLVLGTLVRMRVAGDEDSMLAMPVFGFLYAKLFNPQTYFKEDTDLMFMEAVVAAMHEAVDATTSGTSIRVLAGVSNSASPGGEGEWGAQAAG